MTKTPAVRKLLAGFVLLLGSVTQAFAQSPAPAEMLDPKLAPKFEDVNCTVPTPDELKNCSVELVKGTVPNSNGWLLLDANKKPLRRYFNSTGRMDKDGHTKVDTWSYFKDGVEVYREFDTSGRGIPNNFRWLNTGGMKWGIGGLDSRTGKWTINSWRMISAEEVGFEAFQAVAKNDPARLQALFITEAEMQIVKLPVAKIQAVAAMQRQAPQKFANFVQTVKLAGVKFDGVEGATPNYDTTNGDVEIIKFPSRAIRYSIGEKQHGWIHTGEMIQVGMAAWRIVDVPTNTDPLFAGGAIAPPPPAGNPQLEKPLNLLAELDKNPPRSEPILSNNKEVETYYRKRIELVNQILPVDKESERESWYKQLFDNMTARAQNSGDDAAIAMLKQIKDGVAAKMPASNLAAYGAYREMWTRYAVGMAKIKDDRKLIDALQEKWLDDLSDFVKKYNKADDTPDALSQLAIGCEFAGKIEEAKRWYKELFTSFPDHHHAPRARGSLARLNLVGNVLTLSAPLLNNRTKTFNITQLKGKVVIVHYWSRGSSNYEDDFAKLKRIMNQVGAKNDVEMVSISLDDDAAKAKEAVAAAQLPGIHLFQASNNASGFNSPLATQYGIHILPTLFMVGRNGVVTNNALQIGDIQTELKRVQ
jgi:tetratricopeptide (TPR) repeat protein